MATQTGQPEERLQHRQRKTPNIQEEFLFLMQNQETQNQSSWTQKNLWVQSEPHPALGRLCTPTLSN